MGNGISTDQGNLPTHGKRDVREAGDTRQYDWSELAEAPITKQPTTLSSGMSNPIKPYIGAQLRGQKSSSSNSAEDDTRSGAYIGARTRGPKSSTSPTSFTEDVRDTYIDARQNSTDDVRADEKSRRKSPSPQPTNENSSSDEEDGEVGDVRAEDNGHREGRKKSSLDAGRPATPSETALPKSTNTRDGASARPATGRVAAQRAEEGTATEEELSSLQLTPEKDLQSPTITSRQQECRAETKASTEEQPRGRSSLLELSNRELAEFPRNPLPSTSARDRELAGSPRGSPPCANVQELAEHQRRGASEDKDIRQEAQLLL